MYQDAHIHIQDVDITERDIMLTASGPDKVGRFFCNATSPGDWKEVALLSSSHPEVVPFFGIHPWRINELPGDWDVRLSEYLDMTNSGMGEIGLDKRKKDADFSRQQDIFLQQLVIARNKKRPFVLHCVGAWDEALGAIRKIYGSKASFVAHSFSGSPELCRELLALGAYISPSFRPQRHDLKTIEEVMKIIPDDRLLIETDYPYTGRQTKGAIKDIGTYPERIRGAYKEISAIRNVPVEAIVRSVWQNGDNFLNLSPTEKD